jgi:hypothetical protein
MDQHTDLPSSCIDHTQAKQQHMEQQIANKQTNLPSSWITQPKAATTLGSIHYKQANLPFILG